MNKLVEYTLWLIAFFVVIWSFQVSQVSITALIDGYQYGVDLVKEMFPPNFKNFDTIVELLGETVAMGVWGTLIGTIISLPLGFLGARNLTPNKIVYLLINEFTNIIRSIPDMVYALIFVVSIAVGSLSGILAIVFATVGLLTKFYIESFESIDMKPIEAIKSTGSSYIFMLRHGIFEQALPLISNYTLYLLDHNIRIAMVLGLVGAGGIGMELYGELRYFSYDKVAAMLICILIILSLIDRVSNYAREIILHSSKHNKEYFKKSFVGILFIALGVVAIIYKPLELGSLITGLPRVYETLVSFFPLDFSRVEEFSWLMVETIAMAIAATVIAIIFSVPFGFILAKNIKVFTPIRVITAEFINFLRAMPDLLFAIILVSIVGLSPFAGVLAIALHVSGFLAKFYAETIESIDEKPIEALISTGSSKLHILYHGYFKQIVPLFHSYNLYILDRNVRASTTMGLVGAGGIGFELVMSIKLFEYQQTATIILLIIIVVSIISKVSSYFRKKLV
ncbi:MAG: phosphonate ABC transporter, permease protein PhnE [Epsilonproteobacteria bacterium]|nr:phosphonate ABC transporter, permease protein PhnE [Campylobacterota bacterium]